MTQEPKKQSVRAIGEYIAVQHMQQASENGWIGAVIVGGIGRDVDIAEVENAYWSDGDHARYLIIVGDRNSEVRMDVDGRTIYLVHKSRVAGTIGPA